MSRLARCFRGLQEENRRALIPFITAGDPQPEITVPLMHALVAAGANILELGVPFSDPMADGPVIQRANERALGNGVRLRDVLAMVQTFRLLDATTPVVLMGYLNPFERMGYEVFARAAGEAGVDGVITVDLPPEEAGDFIRALRGNAIDLVCLLAPTTDPDRIARICAQASGFLYYVSLKGVTGAAHLDLASVAEKVAAIKAITAVPVGVGFGIRNAETAARIAAISDAVVIGSVLVERIAALSEQPQHILNEVSAIVATMREAMDGACRDPDLQEPPR